MFVKTKPALDSIQCKLVLLQSVLMNENDSCVHASWQIPYTAMRFRYFVYLYKTQHLLKISLLFTLPITWIRYQKAKINKKHECFSHHPNTKQNISNYRTRMRWTEKQKSVVWSLYSLNWNVFSEKQKSKIKNHMVYNIFVICGWHKRSFDERPHKREFELKKRFWLPYDIFSLSKRR